MHIAVLGAPGTGVTTLAQALAQALEHAPTAHPAMPALHHKPVASVGEATALMWAAGAACARSGGDFGVPPDDPSCLAAAASLRASALVLLTGLDLPWLAGSAAAPPPAMQVAIDAMLRHTLERGGLSYRLVYGLGGQRLAHALAAVDSVFAMKNIAKNVDSTLAPDQNSKKNGVWAWTCERCSDPQCERGLFGHLLATAAQPAASPDQSY